MTGLQHQVCPICGLELLSERRQFRQDDEPATLVVECPVHKSIAQVALKYRTRLRAGTFNTECSIRSSSVPTSEELASPSIVQVHSTDALYAAKIILRGTLTYQSSYYGVLDTLCTDGKSIFHAQEHSFDPVWGTNKDSTICLFEDISEDSDYHISYHRVTRYARTHVGPASKPTLYPISYNLVLDLNNDVTIVAVDLDNLRSEFAVWYICSWCTIDPPVQQLHKCITKSLLHGVFKGYDVVVDSRVPGWHRNTRHIGHPDVLCTIRVARAHVCSNAQGKFVSAQGAYSHYYVHRHVCYLIDALKGTLRCVFAGLVTPGGNCPVVVSGYKQKQSLVMYVVTCTDADTWIMQDNLAVTALIDANEHFSAIETERATNWRSFIPAGQSIVRFQVVPSNDVSVAHMPDVMHELISDSLTAFIKDTNQDVLFIVGTPRAEYFNICRTSRVCWIYDCLWDNDAIDDFVQYNDVTDAYNRCSRHESNVCPMSNWLAQVQHVQCCVCMLDDSAYLEQPRSRFCYVHLDKFILCTNDAEHPIIDDTATTTTITALSDSVVPTLNSQLVEHASPGHDFVISSSSVAPYVILRFNSILQ